MSHAITSSRPLRYKQIRLGEFEAYRVNGTPADCVALGHASMGARRSCSLWHKSWSESWECLLAFWHISRSQTGCIARRAWHSLQHVSEREEGTSFRFDSPLRGEGPRFTTKGRTDASRERKFAAKPKGIRWTRQAIGQYDGEVIRDKDPMGRSVFWFTVKPLDDEAEGTDRWAFAKNLVSIAPLRLDLTAEEDLVRALAIPLSATTTSAQERKAIPRSRKKLRKRRLGVE